MTLVALSGPCLSGLIQSSFPTDLL
jgi:hypothetical protein